MRCSTLRCCWRTLLACGAVLSFLPVSALAGDFTHYESSHVHPVALSEDGRRLFAVNTPEARLSIFRVRRGGRLSFVGDVPVGIEPVSLAVRPGSDEVWVVNHLSDTVSVVDTAARRLIDTIQVHDEPNDVAFAGGYAFVSTSGKDDRVTTYDVVTHAKINSIEVLGEDPRALAVSPDGRHVGMIVLESGNQTTNVTRQGVKNGGGPPPPSPPRRTGLPGPAPRESLIVQFDPSTQRWLDDTGGDWSPFVPFELPDYDFFQIDSQADPPALTERVSQVGTLLFDVAYHPGTGDAWVPNTDARNAVRFEPNLRGHLLETRISIVDPDDGSVTHRDLNPHIDYSVSPGPPEEIERSLAQPGQGVFDAAGERFYLTVFGSSKLAVLDGASGQVLERIGVPGGPSGVALRERGRSKRLYVMSRFEHTIAVVDPRRRGVIQEIGVSGPRAFDPSPPEVRDGRPLLYDGALSSGHGDLSCGSCHVFANWDALAWDLGDPQGDFTFYTDVDWVEFAPNPTRKLGFDPMKGPMSTQTLRGLKGNEPFHWRGDRRNFEHFNGAFDVLLGRDGPIPEEDMNLFADFIMSVEFPPNPFRLLDDSLPPENFLGSPARGEDIFRNKNTLVRLTCNRCHRLPIGSTNNLTGTASDQDKKIPQLRNVYEKIGFNPLRPTPTSNIGSPQQKRGFGLGHSGASSAAEFLFSGFMLEGKEFGDIANFIVMIPTGTAPCVGHQVTVDAASAANAEAFSEIHVMAEQASLGQCDLIAQAHLLEGDIGMLWATEEQRLLSDTTAFAPIGIAELLALLEGNDVVTFSGAPPDNGRRLALDRDRDSCLNGDELRAGSDPASPGELMPDADGDGMPDEWDRCPDGGIEWRGPWWRRRPVCVPYEDEELHPGNVCFDRPVWSSWRR